MRAAARGRFTLYNMCRQGSDHWLYCAYFPEAKTRDFADFWPPDAIVSEMTATGFAGFDFGTDLRLTVTHIREEFW